jgi:hypothetical protein
MRITQTIYMGLPSSNLHQKPKKNLYATSFFAEHERLFKRLEFGHKYFSKFDEGSSIFFKSIILTGDGVYCII